MNDFKADLEDFFNKKSKQKVIKNYVDEDKRSAEMYQEIKEQESAEIKEEILIYIIEQTIKNTGTTLDQIAAHLSKIKQFIFPISKNDIMKCLWELQKEDKIVLIELFN
jgi:hypothetical protein